MGTPVEASVPFGIPVQQPPEQQQCQWQQQAQPTAVPSKGPLEAPVLEGMLEKMPSNGSKTDVTAWRQRYMTFTVKQDRSGGELSWFKADSAEFLEQCKPCGTLYINAGTTVVPVLPEHPLCGLKVTPKGGKPLRIRHADLAEQLRWEQGLLEAIGSLKSGMHSLQLRPPSSSSIGAGRRF